MTDVMTGMRVKKVRQDLVVSALLYALKERNQTDESGARKDRLTQIGASRYHSNTPQVEVDCSV